MKRFFIDPTTESYESDLLKASEQMTLDYDWLKRHTQNLHEIGKVALVTDPDHIMEWDRWRLESDGRENIVAFVDKWLGEYPGRNNAEPDKV